jgi:hypothetical protein
MTICFGLLRRILTMRVKKCWVIQTLITILAVMLFGTSFARAEDCFQATRKLTEDAQNIRLQALDMG